MNQVNPFNKVVYKYRYFLLILYFLILTAVFTRPLLSKISTHTVGGYGDNLYFIWIIGWVKQAIFDLGQLPYKSPLLNHPYGYNLANSEIAPLQILIALPFALIKNPVLGYNISMLSTFFIAGLTMFYWVYSLTKSWGAGLAAATAFAFLPYHSAHFLIGHLNISAIQWFPLYFMGFTQVLTSENFSWKNTLILSAGLAGIALTSQYYLYMSFVVSLIILIICLVFIRRHQFCNKDLWRQLMIAGSLNLPFLIIGILPYFLLYGGGDNVRTLENVMGFSASITDFFLPFTKSLLAGRWVFDHFPRDLWNEATLYMGIPVLALAVIGLWKNTAASRNDLKKLLLTGLVLAFILAMGTNLIWMEKPVVIQTPDWMRSFIRQETFYVFLPGYLMFRYFPFYNIMRVWMRYGIIVLTLLCTAAGLGASRLLGGLKGFVKSLAAAALVGLIILDFINRPYSITKIQPREIDYWLADQHPGGQVQLPLELSFTDSAIYYTLTNQKPLIGKVQAFPSFRYFQLEPILRNFPDNACRQALEAEQITYIVLDEKYFNVDEAFIQAAVSSGFEYAVSIGGQSVFTLPD